MKLGSVFISLQELFSFSRKSKFRILDIQQAQKFQTLARTIHRYHNLALVVTIANIVQHFRDSKKMKIMFFGKYFR